MLFEHGLRWSREFRIRKTADGHGDGVRFSSGLPIHDRPATLTEVEHDLVTRLGLAGVTPGFAIYRHLPAIEKCRQTECTPGAALTLQAVTQRNEHGLAGASDRQSTTGA